MTKIGKKTAASRNEPLNNNFMEEVVNIEAVTSNHEDSAENLPTANKPLVKSRKQARVINSFQMSQSSIHHQSSQGNSNSAITDANSL